MTGLDPRAVEAALAAQGLRWAFDGHALVTTWQGRDFADAMVFVGRVAELAEQADHHPDIDIRWNTVTLRLWSHDVGAVTRRDLALAAAVDAVGGNRPPSGHAGSA